MHSATAGFRELTAPVKRGLCIRSILLMCGVLASALYVAMNVFIPQLYAGFSIASQTVSELSAIGAPTRPLWVAFCAVYSVLLIAFGVGIWMTGRSNRRLRIVGALVITHSVFGLFWPPMHLRGAPFTTTDALHIAFAMVTLLFFIAEIVLGALAFGRGFRIYSAATLLVFLVFGALTGIDGPKIARNLPTPMIGVWERSNIGAFMLWMAVFAVAAMRGHATVEEE